MAPAAVEDEALLGNNLTVKEYTRFVRKSETTLYIKEHDGLDHNNDKCVSYGKIVSVALESCLV